MSSRSAASTDGFARLGRSLGDQRAQIVGGGLIGVGLAGTLDEVILHQLLRWHNFYVHASHDTAIISDGVFHIASTTALVVGLVIALGSTGRMAFRDESSSAEAADLPATRGRRLTGAILIGLGGFNIWDGTINHKVLRLHQVREETDNLLPYDIAFLGIAVGILLIGVMVFRSVPSR